MTLKVLKLKSNISSFSSMSQTYMSTFQLKTTVLCNGFGFTDVFSISLCVKSDK